MTGRDAVGSSPDFIESNRPVFQRAKIAVPMTPRCSRLRLPRLPPEASTYTPRFAAGLGALESRSPRGGAVVLGGGQSGARGRNRVVPWTALTTLAEEMQL